MSIEAVGRLSCHWTWEGQALLAYKGGDQMNGRKLLQQTFGLTLSILLLAACSGSPAQPTATPTPVLPTAPPTPVPPTAAPTPEPIDCTLQCTVVHGDRSTKSGSEAITVSIDEERIYADTDRTYRIVGGFTYDQPSFNIIDYDLSVTGGVFGETPQTCKNP
jgi:hypothetical protein